MEGVEDGVVRFGGFDCFCGCGSVFSSFTSTLSSFFFFKLFTFERLTFILIFFFLVGCFVVVFYLLLLF